MRTRDILTMVRAHAARLGVPLPVLCATAGVAWTTWWRWETGAAAPSRKTVEKLLAVRSAREGVR